jgi:hypothetical protein
VLVAGAVVPATPLLVPEVAGFSTAEAALRRHADTAVTRVLCEAPDEVTVVGVGDRTGPQHGQWDWTGFGVPLRASTGPGLQPGLGVGDWLLDRAGWTGRRRHCSVAPDETAERCRGTGAELAAGARRVALLVCGDGTARRSERAPGHLDLRSEPFDADTARALATGDTAALLRLDVGLATALMATGRAPWQVLAGAAQGEDLRAELLHDEAPYGVAYLVAVWLAATAAAAG